MSSFYIAMGQGLVAPADVRIFTETLYSCTFIAGRDASGTRGGAFHYPAEAFAEVSETLEQWARALQPVEVKLVFAASVSDGIGTPPGDKILLRRWFAQRYPRAVVTPDTATAACMTLIRGVFYAGTASSTNYWDSQEGIDLMPPGVGLQAEYQLFDARPQLRSDSPALVQEASRGRRRRRQSQKKKNCIVM